MWQRLLLLAKNAISFFVMVLILVVNSSENYTYYRILSHVMLCYSILGAGVWLGRTVPEISG